MRESTKTFPKWALVPRGELNREEKELGKTLAVKLSHLNMPQGEVEAFITAFFLSFTAHGYPDHRSPHPLAGIACTPFSGDRSTAPRPGRKRHIIPTVTRPKRREISEPASIAAARLIIETSMPPDEEGSRFFRKMLVEMGQALMELAKTTRWQWLGARQGFKDNRILELHLELAGYPFHDAFGAHLHRGLVAKIRQLQEGGATPEKFAKNLCNTLTPAKALGPLVPREFIEALGEKPDRRALTDMLEEVASWLAGIRSSTRKDYVDKLVSLVFADAEREAYRPRPFVILRKRPYLYREAELDPEKAGESASGHKAWKAAAEAQREELEEEPPGIDEIFLSLTSELPAEIPGIEEMSLKAVGRAVRFARSRIVLDRYHDTAAPGVLTIGEIAFLYGAILLRSKRGLEEELNSAACLVALDMALNLGWKFEDVVAIRLGREKGMYPYLDRETGTLFFRPRAYVAIPERLLGKECEDERACRERIAEWERLSKAYVPVREIVQVSLSKVIFELVKGLTKLRNRALKAFPAPPGITLNRGPLFLLAQRGILRAWGPEDTKAFFKELSSFLARWHPDWPSIRPSHLRKSFEAHYGDCGLGRVPMFYISGIIRDEDEMPLRYSLVPSRWLAKKHQEAEREFRLRVLRAYREMAHRAHTPWPDLPWTEEAMNSFRLPRKATYFGTWHHPYLQNVRKVLEELRLLVSDPDPDTAHNALVTLAVFLLGALCGIRPFEAVNLKRAWLDFEAGMITVKGKDNFARESWRQVPLPGEIAPLLEHLTTKGSPGEALAFHMKAFGKPIRPTVGLVNEWIVKAGDRAGLARDQIFDAYSLRHFFRTQAMLLGFDEETINALMGHQPAGRELFNPYREGPGLLEVIEAGRKLASRIARIIGFTGEGGVWKIP